MVNQNDSEVHKKLDELDNASEIDDLSNLSRSVNTLVSMKVTPRPLD